MGSNRNFRDLGIQGYDVSLEGQGRKPRRVAVCRSGRRANMKRMDRYFTMEDYSYADRSPQRKRFEVIDSVTNRPIGTFTGGPNPEERAEKYSTDRNDRLISA
jgi:hypothetical protein